MTTQGRDTELAEKKLRDRQRPEPPDPWQVAAWSQEELDLLHDMVRDYGRARWFRGQAKWWGIWFIGLPSAAVLVIDPLERLFKFFSGGPR